MKTTPGVTLICHRHQKAVTNSGPNIVHVNPGPSTDRTCDSFRFFLRTVTEVSRVDAVSLLRTPKEGSSVAEEAR